MGESKVIPLHRAAPAGTPLAERDDEALMRLTAADRREAFELLVRRYLTRVAQYCAKFTGSPRGGEDLAQDILLEVWLQRARYRPEGKFPVFLFTLARNRCLNRIRGDARRRRWEEQARRAEERLDDARPDQLDLLLEEEERRRVRGALQELSPKLREAALLRFDQGLGYPEIARIVGRSEVVVRSRVFLALRKLRAQVAEASGASERRDA